MQSTFWRFGGACLPHHRDPPLSCLAHSIFPQQRWAEVVEVVVNAVQPHWNTVLCLLLLVVVSNRTGLRWNQNSYCPKIPNQEPHVSSSLGTTLPGYKSATTLSRTYTTKMYIRASFRFDSFSQVSARRACRLHVKPHCDFSNATTCRHTRS
jgi:hypothetical protein